MSRTQIQLPADSTGKSLLSFDITEPGAPTPNAGVRHVQGIAICDKNGNVVNRPTGAVRVSTEENQLFYDVAPGTDTAVRWSVDGSGSLVQSSTGATLSTTNTASQFERITSIPTFSYVAPGFLVMSWVVKFEAAALTNAYRFWGLSRNAGTPTAAAPVSDGIGFGLGTDGKLRALYQVGGVGAQANVDLSATGSGDAASKQPTDGNAHQYFVYVGDNRVYWYIDSLDQPVASITLFDSRVANFPLSAQALVVNGTSGLNAGGYSLNVKSVSLGDSSGLHSQIADGTYPWRKAKVSSTGEIATAQAENTATASLAAAGSANGLSIPAGGKSTAVIDITGTYNAVPLVVGQTPSGQNITITDFYDLRNSAPLNTNVTSLPTSGTQALRCNVTGFTNLLVYLSTYTSGSATVWISTSGVEPDYQRVRVSDGSDEATIIARGGSPTASDKGLAVMQLASGRPTYAASTPDRTIPTLTAAALDYGLTLWHPNTLLSDVYITEIGVNMRVLQTAGTFNFELSFISAENGTPGGTAVTPQPLNRGNAASGLTLRQAPAVPTLAGAIFQRATTPLPAAAAPHTGSSIAGMIIFQALQGLDDAIMLRSGQAEGLAVRTNVVTALTTAPIYNIYVKYTERA